MGMLESVDTLYLIKKCRYKGYLKDNKINPKTETYAPNDLVGKTHISFGEESLCGILPLNENAFIISAPNYEYELPEFLSKVTCKVCRKLYLEKTEQKARA